jgi:hypothetical protein
MMCLWLRGSNRGSKAVQLTKQEGLAGLALAGLPIAKSLRKRICGLRRRSLRSVSGKAVRAAATTLPRHKRSPYLDSMSPSLSSLLLFASLTGASASACASVFDASKDYFASYAPFVPKYATTFSIRYGKSYKLVNVTADGATTIVTLSVCGAALPSRSELGLSSSASLVQLSLPLTAGLQSTTYAPFIEVSRR